MYELYIIMSVRTTSYDPGVVGANICRYPLSLYFTLIDVTSRIEQYKIFIATNQTTYFPASKISSEK